jgi:hypothetical protein
MDPCPFVQVLVSNLALRMPVAPCLPPTTPRQRGGPGGKGWRQQRWHGLGSDMALPVMGGGGDMASAWPWQSRMGQVHMS